jgi:hypothetical protein
MRFAPSPRLLQVGREDKEAQLKDFAAKDITARLAANTASAHVYTVIARAPDSPVIRALSALGGELIASGIGIRAILMDLDLFIEDQHKPTLLELGNAEIRLLKDMRFAAAHEQLVLSPSRFWIGDCMRRDPAKRDAFEIFHEDNAAAARHAEISFSRLWAKGKPVHRVKPLAPEFMITNKRPRDAKGERRSAPRR